MTGSRHCTATPQLLLASTIHAHSYLFIYEGCDRQAVEAIREGLPKPDVIPPLALVVKPVDPVDGRTLMVATQQEEVLRVLDLQAQRSSSEHTVC